tara:strand:+ start:1328 stop:2275 length:948 start_codon:yes stop_codon:yes gene_type:complete
MKYSINKNANRLVDSLIKNYEKLNLLIKRGPLGSKVVDAGVKTVGSIEAGLQISEICLGGLGKVNLIPSEKYKNSSYFLSVFASKPVLACLGSQYAGWSLSSQNFFSLGSGPVRSIAQKEDIFKELNYTDKSNKTSIILEVDQYPPAEIVKKISEDTKIKSSEITFILTPTTSIAGNIQVVARVLEVAIHKIHELKFPLEKIVHGIGHAPLPPLARNFVSGMGRTNDSIIYGGIVQLFMKGSDVELKKLAKDLPSQNSKDYGKPFEAIFEKYKRDFYKIDGLLFSPAQVIINSLESGKTYSYGKVNKKLIELSFS